MDATTQKFFLGVGLIVVAVLFGLLREKILGYKFSFLWFLGSIPLAALGLYMLKPSLVMDVLHRIGVGG
ncbi:MAG: hypothetical protein IPK07_23165 [Deltaproteobacteria bacterium]|nr:hypothetical protein [Deltaproteobacteria bacterium]